MPCPAANTTRRAAAALGPIMLGMALLTGCGSRGLPSLDAGPGRLVADGAKPVNAVPAASPDSGAEALVGAMRQGLRLAGVTQGGREIVISVDGVQNYSHASHAEFIDFRRRLADVLNGPGPSGPQPVRFVTATERPFDCQLRGAAYLITSGGVDQWELFLRLDATGRPWAIWRAEAPVHVYRNVRGGGPQILFTR